MVQGNFLPRFLRWALPGLAATAALLVLNLSTPGVRPVEAALVNCDVANLAVDSEESAFLTLINNYRAQNGKGALTMSAHLNRAASWMAADMANKNYFSHTDSAGRDPGTRMHNCGLPAAGWGENIAAGTIWDTAQEAFDAWKNSPGHNANMLNGIYKQIGIARFFNSAATYDWYWVTDFSSINDGTSVSGGAAPSTSTPTRTSTPSPTRTATPTATKTTTPTATKTATPTDTSTSTGGGQTLPTSTATSTNTPAATSTATSTATATTTPNGAQASMTSPTPGSTLTSSSVRFTWTAVPGAQQYRLTVGTTLGGTEVFDRTTTQRNLTVGGIPKGTLYVRLWTLSSAGWQFNDYTYTR